MTIPSWGTVSSVLEPTATLLSFVAHHLHAGAAEMHIYLDRDNAAFRDLVRGKEKVRVWVCDDAYWQNEHGIDRPEDSRWRQILNARHGYARAECDWLAHIDGDEFLTRIPLILKFLNEQEPGVTAVSLSNVERVHLRGRKPKTVFDGLFRKPFHEIGSAAERNIYGEGATFLLRGFSGYAIGKTMFRVGAGLTVSIHEPGPVDEWRKPDHPARKWYPRGALLHVDGYTRNHWEQKLREKVATDGKAKAGHNPARTRQIAIFSDHPPEGQGPEWLYEATRTISIRQLLMLLRHRKIFPKRLSLGKALSKEFPDVDVDLSPEAIDAALADLRKGQ